MSRLTEKQKLFVVEYLKCFNATAAAKMAGYSNRSAYSIGQRLLKKDVIQEYLIMYKNELYQELQQQFVAEAITAKKIMTKILNDPNSSDRDRIRVAQDFLDRTGFVRITKSEITSRDGKVIEIKFFEN